MKTKNYAKRLCCLIMCAMLMVLACVESVQATTMTWVDVTDFKPASETMRFISYIEMPADAKPFDGKHYYKKAIPKGEIVYINELYTTCTGQYNIVNYKGKAYYLNKSSFDISQAKKSPD